MKVKIELPELEGYEYTGEYREVAANEYYLDVFGEAKKAEADVYEPYPILKPVEKWIVPTLEYMQENYKWGETVEARVKDTINVEWSMSRLESIDDRYATDDGLSWRYCEIKEKVK
jgi:hypothetical protein